MLVAPSAEAIISRRVGFTVTVTVNTVPVVQPPEVGVTLYVAVSATATAFVRVSFSVLWAVCAPAVPDRSACQMTDQCSQSYVVPVGIVPVGLYENPAVLHDDVVCDAIVATGFTTTLTVNTTPVQLPELGVTLCRHCCCRALVRRIGQCSALTVL